MNTIIHKATTRGHADHGWLESYHSFSFANYQNSDRMNFGMLRVFNDDIVQPKRGFGTHPHNNMEIISIPISGALSHQDSMGNKREIEVDEVQVMSAGTGLMHSEFNDSKTEKTNFFQIWIVPNEQNVIPKYEQKQFNVKERIDQLQILVSSVKSNNAEGLKIHQNAQISRIELSKGNALEYQIKPKENGVYLMNIKGRIMINNETLSTRDAIGIWGSESFKIEAKEDSDLLFVEVPMQ